MVLNDIRKHMLDYMSHIANDNVKMFWINFKTDDDFIYVVSCRWVNELDLDGGRDYILSLSNVKTLLFDYMYNNLGWRHKDYEKVIYNSTDLTDELEDMFNDVSVLRDHKIEEVLSKEIEEINSCFTSEDEKCASIIIKFKNDRNLVCEQDNLIFIGYSKLDNNPIYKMNLPKGAEIIQSVENYLN